MLFDPKAASVPFVLDNYNDKQVWDLWSRLNKDRVIFVGEAISAHMSNIIVAQLLYLESQNSEDDIYMYVNSPGGLVSAGMAIFDTMNYIKPDIQTICIGIAASMGSLLLAAGTKGKRYCLPNAEVMIHQPLGGSQGQATDVMIHAEHLHKLKERLTRILADCTGQPYDKVYKDTDRDNYLSAKEAVEYGLVDEVLYKRA